VVEPMHNPFWKTVESVNQRLTPELTSTISGHNRVGSPQTELISMYADDLHAFRTHGAGVAR
jgi:hypothetical protein